MSNRLSHKFRNAALVITCLIGFGSTGYMIIEGWNVFDSMFMTVTTLTTVGYGETHPLSNEGRLFTMVLILVGVGTLLYVLSDTAEHLIEATDEVAGLIGRRRMKEMIEKLVKHQIVCGFGRTGQEAAYWFSQNKVPFVVVERDESLCREAADKGYLVVKGDASEDEVLSKARVAHAMGIVCALPDDAANTFITLAAKVFNENINIVCRAANPGSAAKMRRAGAHNVISPYILAGRRMASAVTHPLVLDFLDLAMHDSGVDLRMEQVTVKTGSTLVGKTIKDANIKQIAGVMILAVTHDGKLQTNPSPDFVFAEGDIMIALGNDEQLECVSALAKQQK